MGRSRALLLLAAALLAALLLPGGGAAAAAKQPRKRKRPRTAAGAERAPPPPPTVEAWDAVGVRGGWRAPAETTLAEALSLGESRCNIERVDASAMDERTFEAEYRFKRPVILTGFAFADPRRWCRSNRR